MFNFSSGVIRFAVMIVMSVLWTAPASGGQEESKNTASKEHATVSDKDLRSFAKAYVEYHKIRQTYEPRLVKTQDPKEKAKIQKEGDAKVTQTLERYGLTPQSYNRLFKVVNGDDRLRRKALNLINEERNKS